MGAPRWIDPVVQLRRSQPSGPTQSYNCADPSPPERHSGTSAPIPALRSDTVVQVRRSQPSGVTQSYNCADPSPPERHSRTTAPIPALRSDTVVQVRRTRPSGPRRPLGVPRFASLGPAAADRRGGARRPHGLHHDARDHERADPKRLPDEEPPLGVACVGSSALTSEATMQSRVSKGARSQRCSIVRRIDVVSYCVWSIHPRRARRETTIVGTRVPGELGVHGADPAPVRRSAGPQLPASLRRQAGRIRTASGSYPDSRGSRVSNEQGRCGRALAAAHVDDAAATAEVIPVGNRRSRVAGKAHHGAVEGCLFIRVLGAIGP